MNELKPCPFCGGEDKHEHGCVFQYITGFDKEKMKINVNGITRKEFAWLWNTRHERTCKYIGTGRRTKDGQGFVTQDIVYECSECHGDGANTNDGILQLQAVPSWMRYCPNCGARVIGGEE